MIGHIDNKKKSNKKWVGYDRDYAKDHEIINPNEHSAFKETLNLYSPALNEKALEIGCNTGEFCDLISFNYSITIDGIDINVDAVKIAKEKYPSLNFEVKDFFDINKKYDIIYMQHVIEHIQQPEKAFLKLNSILNKGGKLIITCPNHWAYLTKIVCWLRNEKFCYDPTHITEFNPKELSQLIKNAGFNILRVKTNPLWIPFISKMATKLQLRIPSYFFGNFIYILAEKPKI